VRNPQIKLGELIDQRATISLRVFCNKRDIETRLAAITTPTNGDKGKTSEAASREIERTTTPNQTATIKRSPFRSKPSALNVLRIPVPYQKRNKSKKRPNKNKVKH
jgi:hypothetical protein